MMKKLLLSLLFGILLVFTLSNVSAVIRTVTTDAGWTTEADAEPNGILIKTNNYNVFIQNFTKASVVNATTGSIRYANCTIMQSASFSGNVVSFTEINLNPNSYYLLFHDNSGTRAYKGQANPTDLIDGTAEARSFCSLNQTTNIGGIVNVGMSNVTLNNSISTTLNSPANNSQTNNNITTFNATITPRTFNVTNATIYVWFNNGTIYNVTTTELTGNSANTTSWNVTLPIIQNYFWNVLGSQGDGVGENRSFALNNFTRRYISSITNGMIYNITSYETAREIFLANITTNGSTPTNAFLIYNTTIRSATITSVSGNMFNISASIDIPIGVVNNTFYFNFSLGGLETTTDSFGQDVFNTSLLMTSASCIAGSSSYLNLTFANENNLSVLNSINDASTINYWLGGGTIYKTLTTSNSSLNSFYSFCLQPQNQTLKTNITFQYSGSGYPTRTFVRNLWSLTNSTTNQALYLLTSSEGIYVTFQVVNSADQLLSGVIANITRSISGVVSIVGAGTTGLDGVVTYWLDPDVTYTINFFKTGFPFFTATQSFTQTGYTITLGSSSTTADDFTREISWQVSPTGGFLDQNALYNFYYAINSSFWTLNEFGFSLYHVNGTLIGSNSSTSNGGNLSLVNINVSNWTGVYMNSYYLISGNYTNSTKNWIIQPIGGRDYSIWNWFTRLGSYIDSPNGLFGIDNFGKIVISLAVIILSIGLVSTRYGIANEAGVMVILFALVFALDVGLDFIPQIQIGTITSPKYFITALTFLITAIILFREEQR